MEKNLDENRVDHGVRSLSLTKLFTVQNAQGEAGEPVENAALFVCAPRENVKRVNESTPLTLRQETEARVLQCNYFIKDYPDWKECPFISVTVYRFEEVGQALRGFFDHRSGIGSRARKSMVIFLGHGDEHGNLLLHCEKEPVQARNFIQEIDKALRSHYQQAQSEEIPEITEVVLTQCNSHNCPAYSDIHPKIAIKPLSSRIKPATNYNIETREVTRLDGQVHEEVVDSSHTEMSAFVRTQSCCQLHRPKLSSSILGLDSASKPKGYSGRNVISDNEEGCSETLVDLKPKAHFRSQSDGNGNTTMRQLPPEYKEMDVCTTSHAFMASLLPSKRTYSEPSEQVSVVEDMASHWTPLDWSSRTTSPNLSSSDLSRLDMSSCSSFAMFDSFDRAESAESTPHHKSPFQNTTRTDSLASLTGLPSLDKNSCSSLSLQSDVNENQDHSVIVTQPRDKTDLESGYASQSLKGNEPTSFGDQSGVAKKTFFFGLAEAIIKPLETLTQCIPLPSGALTTFFKDETTSPADEKLRSHPAHIEPVAISIPRCRSGPNVTENVTFIAQEVTKANLETPELSNPPSKTRLAHSPTDQAGKTSKETHSSRDTQV